MNSTTVSSAPKSPAIEFRHVSLRFGETHALSDVSFELQCGQMICITGEASSGKSVLLHLAIGLLRPDQGHILIEGSNIENLNETELLAIRNQSMGLAFQEDALFTALPVYDNTAYRLTEHDWPEAKIEHAVLEILRFVGLEKDVDKLPEELSVGMKRRLEIARALTGWPAIMLFDEPASGLDPINARMILDLVIRARDLHNISSLYVTKAIHEISYLATHYAAEDERGQVVIRNGSRQHSPQTKVMVLEKGRATLFGSLTQFETSRLSAVRRMTHPESGAPVAHSYVPDPWSKKLKFREKIL